MYDVRFHCQISLQYETHSIVRWFKAEIRRGEKTEKTERYLESQDSSEWKMTKNVEEGLKPWKFIKPEGEGRKTEERI